MPRCPKCNRPSDTPTATPRAYYCHNCRMEFDPEDDGDYSTFDPSARLRREERARERRKRREACDDAHAN